MEIFKTVIENTNTPQIQELLKSLDNTKDVLLTSENTENPEIVDVQFIKPINQIETLGNIPSSLISEIKDNNVTSYDINPADYGLKITDAEQLKGGNGKENAETTKAILAGKETGAKRDIVLLNAGAAIYCAGIADTLAEGIEKAKESIDSGKALEVLNKLVEFTNR